ncbi:hypothetical protein ST201phi2-1p076 [Pseudomonas phage 201phi2-1]|uniref:Uncharacterized protein n=1 Tax=Pseudomonas phage 201phi2-1 TaxID=198110 RepID=B3FK51_BP201|nr:hypothetical protein ST201phi2-1p076 [Pseudomonas phage 201phi2-1]ABY62909.1 hypothetical protein 201phi2-1p076 [Pseudomonas phage 201phi2-1]
MSSFFPRQKLLHTIATLLMVKNDDTAGETYDEAINETIDELIGRRCSDEDEENPVPTLTDDERHQVAEYLRDAVKAMHPYMPDTGALELVTYVSEPENDKFYLVVRYWPEDEHSSKAFASPSVRG